MGFNWLIKRYIALKTKECCCLAYLFFFNNLAFDAKVIMFQAKGLLCVCRMHGVQGLWGPISAPACLRALVTDPLHPSPLPNLPAVTS